MRAPNNLGNVGIWRTHCPASWPVWARDWAKTPGSLTKRLVALNRGFSVEPVVQGTVLVRRGPAMLPGCERSGLMRQRLVRLCVENAPVVLAQTLVQMDGCVNDWHFWQGLGTRSLGSFLFSDPRVKRGELYFARLPFEQAWLAALLKKDSLSQPLTEMQKFGQGKNWFARCARFTRASERTPLWVMEVFLSRLENYM